MTTDTMPIIIGVVLGFLGLAVMSVLGFIFTMIASFIASIFTTVLGLVAALVTGKWLLDWFNKVKDRKEEADKI